MKPDERALIAAATPDPWSAWANQPHIQRGQYSTKDAFEAGFSAALDSPRVRELLDENERLRQEVQAVAGGALIEEAEQGTRRIYAEVERDMAREALKSADAMNRTWDELNAHRDLLTTERDALRSQLAATERERDEWKREYEALEVGYNAQVQHGRIHWVRAEQAEAECDRLRDGIRERCTCGAADELL